jgi:hypothetical protein
MRLIVKSNCARACYTVKYVFIDVFSTLHCSHFAAANCLFILFSPPLYNVMCPCMSLQHTCLISSVATHVAEGMV